MSLNWRIVGLLGPAVLIGLYGFGFAGAANAKADRTDNPDIVEGSWIRPADVMLIGDSQGLGFFGAQLYRSLSTEPDPKTGKKLTVWSYWTCGSDVINWLDGGVTYCGIRSCNGAGDCARDHGPHEGPGHVRFAALSHYIAIVHPRITIVALGTNMLTTRPAEFRGMYAGYLADVARLSGQIADAGSGCIWIGPPQAALFTKPVKDYQGLVADMARVAKTKGCAFVDSDRLSDRALVLKNDREGTHYQSDGEKAWEVNVWRVLEPVLKAQLTH